MTAHTPGPDRIALFKAHAGLIDAVRAGRWNMVADVVEQMRPAIEARDAAPMLAEALRETSTALHAACMVITDDAARSIALTMVHDARAALKEAGL